jgi:hypothetical protein
MDALSLQPQRQHLAHRYTSNSISVNPNPPRVGVPATINLALKNSTQQSITVERIEVMVAQFGMGVEWEHLPDIGPLQLAADPETIKEVEAQWTPRSTGHRCVQSILHVEGFSQPIHARRNLQVIEASASQTLWRIPFRLGNPADERKPIVLTVNDEYAGEVYTRIHTNSRFMRPGEELWLDAKEEVDANVVVVARTAEAFRSINNIEAFLDGDFLDGIRVAIQRPAYRRDYVITHEMQGRRRARIEEHAVLTAVY